MAELPSGAPPLARIDPEDRRDSWNEIAAYLERDVTTVQRWEKRERMLFDWIGRGAVPVQQHRAALMRALRRARPVSPAGTTSPLDPARLGQ